MKKRVTSFRHAFRGIYDFIALGANAKIQLFATAVVIVAGLVLRLTWNEWIAITLCIGFVLTSEAMNTALEELADEVSEERKERIRRVKDIAAGAVLISSIAAAVVAALILLKRW